MNTFGKKCQLSMLAESVVFHKVLHAVSDSVFDPNVGGDRGGGNFPTHVGFPIITQKR